MGLFSGRKAKEENMAGLDRYDFQRAVNTAVAVLRGKSTAVSPKTARNTIRLAAELGFLSPAE